VRNLHSSWIKCNGECLQSKWTMQEFLNHIGPITCYLQLFINKVHFLGRRLVRISCDQINGLLVKTRYILFSKLVQSLLHKQSWRSLMSSNSWLISESPTVCFPPTAIYILCSSKNISVTPLPCIQALLVLHPQMTGLFDNGCNTFLESCDAASVGWKTLFGSKPCVAPIFVWLSHQFIK
jgi:hypothetical protein